MPDSIPENQIDSAIKTEAQTAELNAFDIRVLAVLVEKEALTPDNYPLSLNAVVVGCNQLSSREPVMSISESGVLDILQSLMQKKLVGEVKQASARVAKYEHRLRIKWILEQDKLAVLTTLMLRGIQTAGELRARCGRLHEFTSIEQVEAALQFLIDKYPPLVAALAKAPGTKETRYAHLLSGDAIIEQQESASVFASSAKLDLRRDRVGQLEEEVVRLRQEMDALALQFAVFKKQFD